jgi:hypothetical protein
MVAGFSPAKTNALLRSPVREYLKSQLSLVFNFELLGSPSTDRTCDNRINSTALYQLSYRGMMVEKMFGGGGWIRTIAL